MSDTDHDTLAQRLMQLLIKLNQGERLEPPTLAKEFGVTLRTIQRDLNERLSHLPLEKVEGRYSLDPAWLGRLNLRDLERFAEVAGIGGLFPSMSDEFLREIFNTQLPSAVLVQGANYETLSGKAPQFQQLEQAINQRRSVSFDYLKVDGPKSYAEVQPHKLINHGGIWYLAATDGGKLKSFSFSKVTRLLVSENRFERNAAIEQRLLDADGIWLTPDKTRVVLHVEAHVANYFQRRRLLPGQAIEEAFPDGSLHLSASVAHANQILPIVRYWIPHVRVLSPTELQAELEAQLRDYLAGH